MVWSTFPTAVLAASVAVGVASAGAPWSYREGLADSLGPSAWGTNYTTCNGQRQSPINLPQDRSGDHIVDKWGTRQHLPLNFMGQCYDFKLKKLGEVYKWELNTDNNKCQVQVRNDDDELAERYNMLQFHVHATSEHTINGHHYAGEIHFVHQVDGGSDLLVTGLLLNAEDGAPENPWLNTVLATMDMGVENQTVPVTIDDNYVDTLHTLVQHSHLFNYLGSLTTPPCSETVTWWVLNNPLSISPEQHQRLREKYKELPETDHGSNNRPTQPINNRLINYY